MGEVGLGRTAAAIALLLSVALGTGQSQATQTASEIAPQALATGAEGGIQLDVVVTDASGNPVTGLQEGDFSLFDNGKPQKIVSFAAFDGVKSKPDPPVEVILMIDALNNSFIEMGFILQGLEKYLRENGGHLSQPTSIARLTVSGMETLSRPSLDGNALAKVVHGIGASNRPIGVYTFPPSMNALARLAQENASKPGRKLLIWLGTGWPTPAIVRETYTSLDERQQRENYQLMVQILEAMLDGHIVLYGGYTASDFYMRDFLKGANKASDLDPRALSLDVLAFKSGGRGELPAINADSVVTAALNHFVREANAYYAISFNPPQAKKADEYHDLRVAIDRAGLNARTVTGYYDQPELHRPQTVQELRKVVEQPAIEEEAAPGMVTVAQLTEILRQDKTKRDAELAKEIDRLQLTERLSSAKLSALSAELPGAKSKAALTAVGDVSVFLEPPVTEIPAKPEADLIEQRRIVSLAVDYLRDTVPKLPNFFARRTTVKFEARRVRNPQAQNAVSKNDGPLRRIGDAVAIVQYRDGKEVVKQEMVKGSDGSEQGLETWGTFGPILSTVIVDAAHSTMRWSHWEEGPNGPMAVFQYQVLKPNSHYEVSYPTIVNTGVDLAAKHRTAYHGEIGIDPDTGRILRLALEADLEPELPMERADIMVEYGEMEIGEKKYTCPLRSVSLSTGRSPSMGGVSFGPISSSEVTRVNDVVFDEYHVFRSEMRIVPD
ncbi:MAG: VWA domain-containing protein [Terracidiphilus sp.]